MARRRRARSGGRSHRPRRTRARPRRSSARERRSTPPGGHTLDHERFRPRERGGQLVKLDGHADVGAGLDESVSQQPVTEIQGPHGGADVPGAGHAVSLKPRDRGGDRGIGIGRTEVCPDDAVVVVDGRATDDPVDAGSAVLLGTGGTAHREQELGAVLLDGVDHALIGDIGTVGHEPSRCRNSTSSRGTTIRSCPTRDHGPCRGGQSSRGGRLEPVAWSTIYRQMPSLPRWTISAELPRMIAVPSRRFAT